MGQGEEVKTRSEPVVEILERGEIFFFYRPKVNKEEAHSPDDVQRLYIVLRPESGARPLEEKQASDSGKEGGMSSKEGEGGEGVKQGYKGKAYEPGSDGGHGSEEVSIEKQTLFRLIVMGRKSLPDPSKRGRPYWGFVELVSTKIEDIKQALEGEEYDTATRGHRRTFPARPLAEGVYGILRHESERKTHTHLVYRLELPPEDARNEPQESLNIEREGSFLIQIKNPGKASSGQFPGLQNKRKATYPAHLQGRLGRLRFSPADPPDFLNYEGCEFLLISASDNIDEELGLELKIEPGSVSVECSDLIRTFGKIAPLKPLLRGTWL